MNMRCQITVVAQRWATPQQFTRELWGEFIWALLPVAAATGNMLLGGMLKLRIPGYHASSI